MRRLIVLLAALPAIASGQNPTPAQIDAVFSRFDHRDSPGCILGVSRAGKVVYEKGYGMADLEREVPITPASIFHVASISKQFTAMAILLLEQQGKLSIEDDVRKYIPELPDYGKRITLRHLLQHTSGIRDQWTLLRLAGWRDDDLITEDDVMWAVTRQRALNFDPGAEYLYSNSGFTLLAVIVKRVSGHSLREFADEQIFKPLGMVHTHFHDDHTMVVPHRTSAYEPRQGGGWSVSIPVFDTYGATSLFTTAEDLLRWEQNFSAPVVGSPVLLTRMQQEGILNDGSKTGYALGIAVGTHRGVREIGHSGADAGYRADVERYPDQQLAVTALCNASNSNPGLLTRQVADLYLGSALAPEPSQARQAGTVTLPGERLAALVGIYRRTTGDLLRLDVREGKLWIAEGARTELLPLSDSRFALRGVEGQAVFDSTSAGRVLRLRRGILPEQVFQQMTAFSPTPAQLAAFAGRYRSAELETVVDIKATDSTLVMSERRPGSIVMRPVYTDAFRGGFGVTEFTRDASGRVTGFVVNAGRVRALRFDRIE
ncbi:MAG TPA: serine hydrolase domain-containing protein [Gemmatimonadaceae bacterium]|nr:serine hydrolase domain-containing protein [Gemmatimonadaceae bacterium]